MMKRGDYCNITSCRELRMVREENEKALKLLKDNVPGHCAALAESLSPKTLWNGVMRYVSPLLALYRRLFK